MDGSVTRDCDRDTHGQALAATLVEFATRLGASLVVEAVETPDELATVRNLGPPLAQGYLFAAPGRLEDLRTSYPTDIPDSYPLASR